MGLARTFAITLTGLVGQIVEIECDISGGVPGLSFTGLPDTAVNESRDRLRAAIVNSGAEWPNRRITVALLPADVRKSGSGLDLAVGIALLAASRQIDPALVDGAVWIGELGLDGRLRRVRGVLPAVLAARDQGFERVVVARANGAEAAMVSGVEVRAADTLAELIGWLTGRGDALDRIERCDLGDHVHIVEAPELADVAGQPTAKRALEIAAAGGHHTYLVGTPGAGKTMLAQRLPGLLPPLDVEQALEVTSIQSIAGRLGDRSGLVATAPFEAPHHTASVAALVGGGSHLARPGAISLAHCGVLFLDEAPEFVPRALDALRQPLEVGHVVLQRSGGSVRYPSRFQLVMAANPCACGLRAVDCICAPQVLRRHRQRLSGPLLDRIDLRVQVDPVSRGELLDPISDRDTTAQVAARVAVARERARDRLVSTPWTRNADVPGSALRSPDWLPDRSALRLAESFIDRGILTARGLDRVLRIAWTLADLAAQPRPDADHVAEALFFRTGWAEAWAA